MSGREEIELRIARERREAALRRAEEEERRRALEAARARHHDAAGNAKRETERSGEVVAWLRSESEIARRSAADASALTSAAERLERATAVAARVGSLLQEVGPETRRALAVQFRSCRGSDEALRIITDWAATGSAAARSAVEESLARAQAAIEVLEACDCAKLELPSRVRDARSRLAEVVASLGPQSIAAIQAEVGKLQLPFLRAKLQVRSESARVLAVQLSRDAELRAELAEYRVGAPEDVAAAAASAAKGDWRGAARGLREMDAFLDARSRCRLEEVRQAAEGAQFRTSAPRLDAATRTWIVDLTGPAGVQARAGEPTGDWVRFSAQGAGPMRLDGPPSWKHAECDERLVKPLLAQLQKRGCAARVSRPPLARMRATAVAPAPARRKRGLKRS